jgi:HME family heavy-metal exporter
MVFVEFDWNTDVQSQAINSRKIKSIELPKGLDHNLVSISSIMGQIMMVAVTGDTTSASTLRTISDSYHKKKIDEYKVRAR